MVEQLRVVLTDAAMTLQLLKQLKPSLDVLLEIIGDGAEGEHHLQVNPADAVADFDQRLLELDLLVSRGLKSHDSVGEGGVRYRRNEVREGVLLAEVLDTLCKLLKVVHSLEQLL